MKKEKIIFIISLIMMLLATSISVYATSCLYSSSDVSYSPPTGSGLSANVQDSLTEVYGHCTDYTNLEQRVSTIENNFLDKTYPVGSIYISTTDSTVSAVQSRFGGTWEAYGQGRTLISANSTYPINTTGGSASHQHKYGLQYGAFWGAVSLENDPNAGLLNYSDGTNYTIINSSSKILEVATNANKSVDSGNKSLTVGHFKIIANTSATSSLPPYISVYMYKRVS